MYTCYMLLFQKHAADTNEAVDASEQVEINAAADRYMAILQTMVDRLG